MLSWRSVDIVQGLGGLEIVTFALEYGGHAVNSTASCGHQKVAEVVAWPKAGSQVLHER
ncbi:unnamed protein product [Ectocarpus sp. 6 AP-2014]